MLRFLSTIFVIVSTYAYRQDLAKLPNGNSYGLTLGHPGGNTKVPTKLASTFYAAGQQWTKAFCMADADGDGQSNGLEMGDPCCKWSVGQTPQLTTGLSDPNSAESKTLNTIPSCMMSYANANVKLQCAVCVQALQLDMAKPSDNVVEFTLISVKSCKDATQDDAQKNICFETFLKNVDQLFMDQKNGVAPIQSCMNLGLMCMAPPTQVPTTTPTPTVMPTPTQAPTQVPTTTPTVMPTPTPTPTKFPTAPPPPRSGSMLQVASAVVEPSTSVMDSILVPVLVSAGGAIILTLLLWRVCKKDNEVALSIDGDFHALPDVEYVRNA